ncbi:hypothetical protein GCM10010123_20020 [Pilimelia anulata]|uniref:Uncharacterized protein n=1 Tax=Pilimelia anulata TaxID=53371 RepID=A0A8J3FC64_9ACTN|nr:hypothetical protein [Pilimelia anulata]GGJ90226.1 hypothetical protein GCM10010123_20020 [Pilimelia anulata]
MGKAFLSFLEVVRRGSGPVDAAFAGWLEPRDQRELAILDAFGAPRVRLAGWVRDDLSDRVAGLLHRTSTAKARVRLAELACYYLRPIDAEHRTASRATLSNWRREAADEVAADLAASGPPGLGLQLTGLPRDGERVDLESLARDPAVWWLMRLDPQERDLALHRALADAAAEARAKGDLRALVGVAMIASRIAPANNPEPDKDVDGTPLRGMDGRKFTRTRRALPLVLFCLQRAALHANLPPNAARQTALTVGHRLVESTATIATQQGPLSSLVAERSFDPDLLAEGIDYAWQMIATADAKPILAALTRYAAIASDLLDDRQHRELALVSVAVARRHSDRRALDIDLHHPAFRSDSAGSVLFQLRFRRERLLLASHYNPGGDWHPELTRMGDLLTVRRKLLPATEVRRMEKVRLHLQQGILLRRARELTAAGQPMDTPAAALDDHRVRAAIRAIEDMVSSMRTSFAIADQDSDGTTAVNAHRRKTEADGVVHLLSRVAHPDALAGARRLRRDLNRLDDVYSDQVTDLRTDVTVLWLLAMADQAIRHSETEQARYYLTTVVTELPDGIPHLAIRSASIAASLGESELARRLLDRIPRSSTWPSYLKHLVARLRSVDPR